MNVFSSSIFSLPRAFSQGRMIGTILAVGLIAFVIKWILKPEPSPIFGIYSQPGKFYYLKFAVFYLLVTFRKWQSKRARADEKLTGGIGMKSKFDVKEMETTQTLSEHPKAIDAVYFQGANKDGLYFIAATARRPHHVINGFVFLKVPGEGLLTSPKLPDSTLFGTEDEFGAEGLKFEPLEPMRKWKMSYKGQMRRDMTDELIDVELDAIWSTTLRQFDFDTDMSSTAIARAFAREPWSREYFEMLKEAHQTHYEQMGNTNGTVKIAGKSYPFNIDSMRDHSYGNKREWKLLHRYGFHTMKLEDGTRINVGIVSQPCTSSVLELGYVYLADGRLFPVDECGFNIWDIGENGSPPKDYHFTFKAANRWWSVQVNVVDAPIFYIGWEWEAKIHERMCTFQVDGVPGWGISEFMYRNMGPGRPEEYNKTDPEWTRTINKG